MASKMTVLNSTAVELHGMRVAVYHRLYPALDAVVGKIPDWRDFRPSEEQLLAIAAETGFHLDNVREAADAFVARNQEPC